MYVGDFGDRAETTFGEFGAKSCRKVCHGVRVEDPSLVDPGKHLSCDERPFPESRKIRLPFLRQTRDGMERPRFHGAVRIARVALGQVVGVGMIRKARELSIAVKNGVRLELYVLLKVAYIGASKSNRTS